MAEILSIPVKSITYEYRGQKATITYVRDTKEWEWEFENVVVTQYRGVSKTLDAAKKEVNHYVDTIIGPGAS